MDNILTVHFVAATRQRYPQLLTRFDNVDVLDPVHFPDPLVLNQSTEHGRRDFIRRVAFLDGVYRDTVRDSGAVEAGTGDGDSDSLVRAHGIVTSGGEREVVCGQDRPEMLDGEEGSDVAERGSVLRRETHERATRGGFSAAFEAASHFGGGEG